ncbi:MAG: exosortase/archaeosortase family protein [PVC group bacterium]
MDCTPEATTDRPGTGAWKKAAPAVLLALVLIVVFWPTLRWMNERFFEENSYYGHGWLIAAAIGFLLYQRRGAITRQPARPSWRGLAVAAGGLLLHLVAQFFGVNFLSAASLPVVVIGLVLAHWGPRRARCFIGPLFLCVFMIPLPGIWIISIAFRLKLYSAAAGVALARALGIAIVRNGIEIYLPAAPPGEVLTIGDPCSGLRSLISFGALGGFFFFLFPLSLLRRSAIFLTAVLLAPLSNILRVVGLIVLRQTIGPGVLRGPWHVILGVLIFFLCFFIFLQVVRWLLR